MNSRDDDETFTRELLEEAGPRPAVAEEELTAIRDLARAAWRERYGRRERSRSWMLPLAASLILAFSLAVWLATRPAVDLPVAIVATVERVNGPLTLSRGQSLIAGSVVETQIDARAGLRLAGGQSLRLDAGTRVVLASASLVELQRGAVYVDSTSVDKLTIRTANGDATPVGTQFEVRLETGTTHLRVREGRVTLEHHDRSDIASAGEELVIGRAGEMARTTIRPDAPSWDWVLETARVPPIEGRPLESFLRWFVREKGWTLTFATARAEALASTTILHGSIDELEPDDALRTVALSSGVEYRVRNGVLIVGVR